MSQFEADKIKKAVNGAIVLMDMGIFVLHPGFQVEAIIDGIIQFRSNRSWLRDLRETR